MKNWNLYTLKSAYLGFKPGVKGYRLWHLETCRVIINKDVNFNESTMLHDLPPGDLNHKQKQSSSTPVELHIDTEPETISQVSPELKSNESPLSDPSPQNSIATDRDRRIIKSPQRYA